MNKIICERISNWNKARYIRRDYNHSLFVHMLYEEYNEYKDAILMEDKLDGLADLYFILIGALWKLKLKSYNFLKHNDLLLDNIEYNSIYNNPVNSQLEMLLHLINKISSSDDEEEIKGFIGLLTKYIISEFYYLGCKTIEIELAVIIVCDSNDTKEVIKLKDYDKGELKGAKYKSPLKRLNLLAEVIKNG